MFHINTVIFLTVTAVLVACKTAEPVPVEVVTVPVPVAVPCVESLPQHPPWQVEWTEGMGDVHFIKQVMHDALIARGYIAELEAVLLACK